MKILNKKIWNKAATFLLTAVLLCWNAVQVSAYTADSSMTGYPFIVENFRLRISKGGGQYVEKYISLVEQNSYTATLDAVDLLNWVELGNYESSFIFPYDPELYDYHLVGTIGFSASAHRMNLDFSGLYAYTMINGSITSKKLSCDIYDFNSQYLTGFSFSADLSELANSNLNVIMFDFEDTSYIPACDFWFSASVIPVAKGTEAEQLNQSILNELIKINQNLVTSNSLQQPTIDAINQHDANEKSWFQQLIQSMGIGFSTLYEQMKKEQDDKLYGYQKSVIPDASDKFNTGASKLEEIEGELSGTSNQYVNDYTTEAYDVSLLETLGPSVVFVVTWFTNFWNMGGAFTACLNLCFAMFIAFYVLRTRR